MTPPVARAGSLSTTEHDVTERQDAARALLARPLLTNVRHPEPLALVRRHAAALKQMFAATLGYQLIVESTFARLIKPPLSQDTAARPALRTTGQPFLPRTYAYLALVSASLLANGTGGQVLLSALVEQVRADAVTAGLQLTDTYAESRHLVQALLVLLDWGVLSETDGTVAGWGARQDDALLDVHRSLVPHLLSGPLAELTSPVQLLAPDPDAVDTIGGPEQPRRSLRRKLAENPLVRREDLTVGERDVLSRERTELARVLDEAFGLTLEVRLEGALAYDTRGELTDVAFPSTGTVRHAALLLTDALLEDLQVTPDNSVRIHDTDVPGALAPWTLVEQHVRLLIERYGSAFSAAYVADPQLLTDEVVALLSSLSLARSVPAGLVLHPACGRYRPDPQRAAARTRTREAGQPGTDPSPEVGWALFPDLPADPTETR